MSINNRFEGQIAIITGSARGIGLETAKRLSSEGAKVVLIDNNKKGLDKAAKDIKDMGGLAESCQVDVTDESKVRSAIDSIFNTYRAVHILVNNVGIYPHIKFEEITFEQWKNILSVNLDSAFLCTHSVFPYMKQAGYGRIVNFASGVFFNGQPGLTAYSASKGGIIGFTRVLAKEGGVHGITANVVSPGLVESEGVLEEIEHLFDFVVQDQSIKRRGKTRDIADCIAYLSSSEAGFITGQTINIDGGARFN